MCCLIRWWGSKLRLDASSTPQVAWHHAHLRELYGASFQNNGQKRCQNWGQPFRILPSCTEHPRPLHGNVHPSIDMSRLRTIVEVGCLAVSIYFMHLQICITIYVIILPLSVLQCISARSRRCLQFISENIMEEIHPCSTESYVALVMPHPTRFSERIQVSLLHNREEG